MNTCSCASITEYHTLLMGSKQLLRNHTRLLCTMTGVGDDAQCVGNAHTNLQPVKLHRFSMGASACIEMPLLSKHTNILLFPAATPLASASVSNAFSSFKGPCAHIECDREVVEFCRRQAKTFAWRSCHSGCCS